MPQVTSLRLLMNHSSHFFLPKPRTLQPIRPLSLSVVFSSLPRRHNKNLPSSPNPLNSRSRGKSSLIETKTEDKPQKMEGTESIRFNKRRAEGKDKGDKPKNLQLKARKLNPVNTTCYLQVLGTGMDTQDTSPSVLLFFDKQRFIFNAGEGLLRFCAEHKIKLSKIDHIFLSRVCSETAGGLPGLLLTLAGMGEEGMCVNMWGPSGLKYLVAAMKTFIPNAAMVHTHSFGPSPDNDGIVMLDSTKFSEPIKLVDDELVKISAILLRPNGRIDPKSGPQESTIKEGKNESIVSHCANNESGTAIKPGDLSVIYVCELPEIQGKFYPEKAQALGLNPGPKYKALQLNKSVKSDLLDIMVEPSDVMDPPIPGPIVLLVDCPTLSHLENLLSVDSLNEYCTNFSDDRSENAKVVNCVIHLSPSSVTSSPDYQRWMKRFGKAQHIMAGHERPLKAPILCRISLSRCVNSNYMVQFNLRPLTSLGFDKSSIPVSTNRSEIVKELLTEIPEIVDAARQVRQLWDHPVEGNGHAVSSDGSIIEEPWIDELGLPSCLENICREDMEIVLLGTGSSQPSKYRNVSSIYINLFSEGSLLLDCGEGTLGQLKRRFGVEGADNAVRSLRCIWISHIHADHHTGLARILALRRDLLKGIPHEPLLVVGPGQLLRFLSAYQRLEELDMEFLDCRHTTQASWDAFDSSLDADIEKSAPANSGNGVDSTLFAKGSPMQSYWKRPGSPPNNSAAQLMLSKLKKLLQDAGLERLVSFPVVHCSQAFGVTLQAAERTNSVGEVIAGWKVVYSGDTRPCPALIEASRGATVLIHEATFEDEMVDEAIARNHSTTKEAMEVGEAAGVYRIILTHFSQRYPKIPVFEATHMHNVCIGFDMMSINVADLPVLPRVLPHLKLLFRNEMGFDESDEVVHGVGAVSS
ncbi:hypothetical protein Cgig2_020495 [Carnegiea gigantea]|uniref:ribonuclease Z n=1 Tax=Carnegiea gigantea TaxID=171969 RepID=A0A9Q1QF96_9CARY|nr:hypothetical protein Cgig2_020495 [Carnegiea gigantea]